MDSWTPIAKLLISIKTQSLIHSKITYFATFMCRKAKNVSIGQADEILVGVPMAGTVAAVIAFP